MVWLNGCYLRHWPASNSRDRRSKAATELLESRQRVGEFCNFSIFTPRMKLMVYFMVDTVIMSAPTVLRHRLPVTVVDIKCNRMECFNSVAINDHS